MSSHDLFDLPTERTEFSDAGYAAFGRSLVFATRFEENCRALAVLLGIKDRTQAQRNDSTLLDDEEFRKLVGALWNRKLFHQIQALTTSLHLTNDLRTVLNAARKARNYLAHDFGLGIQHEIETDGGHAQRLDDLGNQITTLATADMVVCLLMLHLTHEGLPSSQFISEYPSRIKEWVCDTES